MSWASSPSVRLSMQHNRPRDSRPELALRSAAHRLGLRFRVHVRPIPRLRRTGDLVFTRSKVVVFLDGCYWHGCADHYYAPRTNSDFWNKKLQENRARDSETDRLLAAEGWLVLRVWEHEDPEAAALNIRQLLTTSSLPPKTARCVAAD